MTQFFKSNYEENSEQIRQLIAAFRKLPPKVAKGRIKQGLRRAIKPFLPALRSATPHRTGGLMRAAISIVKFYNKSDHGAVVGIVGYSRKTVTKKRKGVVTTGAGYHSHLVEKGTKPRQRKSGGSTGSMPAAFMVRDTYAQYKGRILLAVENELAKSLEKAAEDLRKT